MQNTVYAATFKTNLPIALNKDSSAPQHNAVTWALWAGRSLLLRDEPTTATLVLIAFAQHATASLNSGQGYSATHEGDITYLTGLSTSTVRRYVKVLLQRHLLVQHSNGYRVPEAAVTGDWLDMKVDDYRR